MKILKMPGQGSTEIEPQEMAAANTTQSFVIPPDIVRAISAVQNSIDKAVEKDQKNNHVGYQFASTDAIYAALMKIMGEKGLVCLPMQVEEPSKVEVAGKTFVKFTFQFVLATEKASWTHEWNRRTVWMQMQGPQTFQGGQSYTEKAYLKSLFKLATGDLDLETSAVQNIDQSEYGELPNVKPVNNKKPGFDKEGRPTSYAAKKDPELVSDFNRLRDGIPLETEIESLEQCKTDNVKPNEEGEILEWGRFPRAWANELEEQFKQRRFDILQEAERSTHGLNDAQHGMI